MIMEGYIYEEDLGISPDTAYELDFLAAGRRRTVFLQITIDKTNLFRCFGFF